VIEAGFAGFDLGNWVANRRPAGMPKEMLPVDGEIGKILREPATRDKISAQGFNIVHQPPDELAAYLRLGAREMGEAGEKCRGRR